MTDKPEKPLPWMDDDGSLSSSKANEQALAKARRRRKASSSTGSSAERAYAEKAFNEEIRKLEQTKEGGRNDQLNESAFNLGQLVAAGVLDEHTVTEALIEACRVNGHLQDDGRSMVIGSIKSGIGGGKSSPRDMSGVGSKTSGANVFSLADGEPVETPTAQNLDSVYDIEDGFWTSRDSLKHIYLAALSRLCPPWAVLGHCAARALTLVRPNCTLPPIIGSAGSLNWYCAIAAPSGAGKSASASVAKELVNEFVLERNLGSGEGTVDAYVKPANKEANEPAGMHESVMFFADEGDVLKALSSRTGSTLDTVIRSGFNGETLGFSYRQASNKHLERHSYRMTLVINVQAAKGQALIDDEYGGTLQRFMWFPGIDQRISADMPHFPGELTLPSPGTWQYPRELQIPNHARDIIIDSRVARASGAAVPGNASHLDGHALFIREKFAYALAVLDGRAHMTDEDWELAGIASRVSEFTRRWVITTTEAAARDEAVKRGTLQGVSNAAADEEKSAVVNEKLNRIAKWVMKKIKDSESGITQRDLVRSIASRDRPSLTTVLDALADTGKIKRDSDTGWWVKGG